MPDWLSSALLWSALDTLGGVGVPIGVAVVAVVVSLGAVVVGEADAWGAPDEKLSSPTVPTKPTTATGARYRAVNSRLIPGRTYLRRNRQE